MRFHFDDESGQIMLQVRGVQTELINVDQVLECNTPTRLLYVLAFEIHALGKSVESAGSGVDKVAVMDQAKTLVEDMLRQTGVKQ